MLFLPREPETPSAEENFQGLEGRESENQGQKGMLDNMDRWKITHKTKTQESFSANNFWAYLTLPKLKQSANDF